MYQEVRLSRADLKETEFVGRRRQAEIERLGRNGVGTRDSLDKALHHNIEGARRELAAARALGIPWPAYVNTFRNLPDVGPFEVRGTDYHHGHLILYPNDELESVFIFVTGKDGYYRIHGWISGFEAKQGWNQHDYGDPISSWWVPAKELYEMSEIWIVKEAVYGSPR